MKLRQSSAYYKSVFRGEVFYKSAALYRRFSKMQDQDAIQLMEEIRKAEISANDSELLKTHTKDTINSMQHFRDLPPTNIDNMAYKYALYRAYTPMHLAYIHTRSFDPNRLGFDEGFLRELSSLSLKGPLIVAPLHTGPTAAALGILARYMPLSPLVIPTDDMQVAISTANYPLDIEPIPVGGSSAIMCRRAIARGRVLALAPDMLPDPDQPRTTVRFMGEKIECSLGIELLANIFEATVVPIVFRYESHGRYSMKIVDVMRPSNQQGEMLQKIMTELEKELKRRKAWEWFGWKYICSQLTGDQS